METPATSMPLEDLVAEAMAMLRNYAARSRGQPLLHASDWEMTLGRVASATARKIGQKAGVATEIQPFLKPLLDEVRAVQALAADDASISTLASEFVALATIAVRSPVPHRFSEEEDLLSFALNSFSIGALGGSEIRMVLPVLVERISAITRFRSNNRSLSHEDLDTIAEPHLRVHRLKDRAAEMGGVFEKILDGDRAKLQSAVRSFHGVATAAGSDTLQ